MSQSYPMTKAGKAKLKQELTYLKEERRTQLAQDIHDARKFCDFSEDTTFQDLLHQREALDERIQSLEASLRNATLLTEEHTSSTVTLGSTVTIQDLSDGDKETYTIVGTTEADPSQDKISHVSPVAKSLLHHGVNDVVDLQTPAGKRTVKIEHIS